MTSLISELDMAYQGAMEKAGDANHPGNPEDDFTDAMLYKRARDRINELEAVLAWCGGLPYAGGKSLKDVEPVKSALTNSKREAP